MANRYWVGGTDNWNATAGTKWALTSGGAGGQAVPSGSDDVFLDAASGAVTVTISANVTAKTVNCTGFTGTLAQNTFSQLTASGSVTLVSTMTYSPTDSSSGGQTGIVFSTTATLTTGGKLLHTVSSTASGFTITLGDNLSFMASKYCKLQGNATVNMNGFSINGNSVTNRVLITSSTLGTARTITNATTSFTNADFRDITFSSASSLDLSAITGNSGDCGGNTITGGGSTLTFTTGATQTATGSSANWSTATWSARVPLPQDDVVLSLTAGQTLTNDMPRMGKSISLTTAMNLTLGLASTNYGSLDLTNISTFSGSFTWTFEGRGTFNLTSAGKAFPNQLTVAMVGGTLTPQDAVNVGTTFFNLNSGTFTNSGNFSITCGVYTPAASTTTNMGNATWNLNQSAALTLWAPNASSTINAQGSTILFVNTGTNAQTFAGAGKTYNNLQGRSGTGGVIISGSNTFNTITIPSSGKLTLTSATTQTVSNFVATGTAGNLITLNATSLTTTPPILSTTNGYMNCQYVDVQGVNVTPAGRWFSGNKKAHLGLDFGGQAATGDYVSAANSASGNQIFGATSFSVEVWCVNRGTGGGTFGRVLDKGILTPIGYDLVNSNGNWAFEIVDNAATKKTSGQKTVVNNVLAHIVGVWDGSNIRMYLNDSVSTDTAASVTAGDDSAQSLTIGNVSARTRTFDGQIYLTRLYRNVALSAANVTTLYNGGVMTKTSNPLGNATAEYLFHEGTGSTLTDSISAVNGTITGADWSNTGWRDGSSMDMFRSI